MRFWKRDGDRELEAQLRRGRPEPEPEVTRAIADRVRPRGSGLMRGLRHVPVGLAAGLTAIVLTVAIALGGASSTLNAAGDALNVQSTPHRSLFEPTPTDDQYGNRVTVCIVGRVQVRLSRVAAQVLVRVGVATRGPCSSSGSFRGFPRGFPFQR